MQIYYPIFCVLAQVLFGTWDFFSLLMRFSYETELIHVKSLQDSCKGMFGMQEFSRKHAAIS